MKDPALNLLIFFNTNEISSQQLLSTLTRAENRNVYSYSVPTATVKTPPPSRLTKKN